MTVHFYNSPYEVEVEKDLTIRKQLLDIIIIKRYKDSGFNLYPAGLENMSKHNLISYKSIHESFTVWSLMELIGHYVNYRKQTSKSLSNLLPEEDYRLYGLTTHEPTQLMGRLKWKTVSEGVYDIECVTMNVRLIVLSKIPKSANNELWRLFSARAEVVEEAISHYQESYRKSEYSILMQQLYEFYLKEKLPMTYTLEQFKKDFVISHLREIPTEEVLKQYSLEEIKQYSPKELLKQYSLEEIKQYSPKELLKQYSLEEIKQYSPKELLKQYSLEEIKQYSPKELLKQYSPQDLVEGLSPETLQHLAVVLSQLGVNQIKNQEQ
ncbi:hypothetical protein C6N34_002120 [Cylindrospermopsis raciborskii Cr2010]|uniref:hypothetical protein n=2 Tax=Cylindrospermopsis raciborskii TaxID=77022 RepID=UPI001F27401E|nr:hypothetical protein [Cylindrospermopsis raciborskii]UJL34062.1 hypothetical protein C6N34_002120 [Cylindrospermopsis raciborskii Cr2010]